jgi:type IV secretion system protein VirD4
MSHSAGAAAWSPPARPALAPRIARFFLAGGAALILAQYLAGFFFLWSLRTEIRSATPLTVLRYAYYYGDRIDVRRRLLVCSAVGLTLVAACALVAFLPRRPSLHGDARFATRQEVAAAGLLEGEGLILGRIGGFGPFGGEYLALPGQQGVALSAQPRAGKGVGVVIPNLLSWGGSVVCVDIKKENWALTAGFRAQHGHKTFLFDPLSRGGRTHRWNLLDFVEDSPGQLISDLQLVANMLFPHPVNTDPFWMASARSLFLGIGLYLFATPSMPRTIGEILRQGMANDEEGFSHHWRRVIQGRMSGRNPLPEQCVRALFDVIDLAPQTTSSIRKTFTSRLELWANPILDAATAASDFDLRELRTKPMSIYLGVMPKDLERLAPLLSLFFQQAIALQTDQLPEHNPALKYQVLMLLDEFPALGPIPIIAKASGFLSGYNVRTLMIMQTPAQLRDVYGHDGANTLLKTLAARIFFAPKDMDDAQEISKELGFTTVKVKTYSKPVFDFSNLSGRRHRSVSVSVSEQPRALMLPQELREMGAGREIIFTENVRPIMARKIRYYAVPELLRRVRRPPRVRAIEPITVARHAVGETWEVDAVTSNRLMECTEGDACTQTTPRVREGVPEDIEHLESLTLEDFATDFSKVEIPDRDGPVSEPEMKAAVDSFLNSLERT